MSAPVIRTAQPSDADAMCAVLNPIIEAGGTTAHMQTFTVDRMKVHYITSDWRICVHLAETRGEVLGFQSLAWPDPDYGMAEGWAIIATFVMPGRTGLGIGARLFDATRSAARRSGVRTIDATIRADNAGGLKFYDRMGFVDYKGLPDVPLRDGTRVDRICKRYDF